MLLGCRIWSPRVFEIRARKRLPWKCELCASSFMRANPRVKKERKKKRETLLLLLLFTFLSVSLFYPYLPFSMMPFLRRESAFACILRVRRRVCPRRIDPRAFVSSRLSFFGLSKVVFFVTRKAPFEKHQKKEATRRRKSASPSRSTHIHTHTERERERENERERTRERERERTRAEKEANRWWKDTT